MDYDIRPGGADVIHSGVAVCEIDGHFDVSGGP
jgi:hypothetical protein